MEAFNEKKLESIAKKHRSYATMELDKIYSYPEKYDFSYLTKELKKKGYDKKLSSQQEDELKKAVQDIIDSHEKIYIKRSKARQQAELDKYIDEHLNEVDTLEKKIDDKLAIIQNEGTVPELKNVLQVLDRCIY